MTVPKGAVSQKGTVRNGRMAISRGADKLYCSNRHASHIEGIRPAFQMSARSRRLSLAREIKL